jgi:hypothetical protein
MPELIQPNRGELGKEHWLWDRNPDSYSDPMAPLFIAPHCDLYPSCKLKLSSRSLEKEGLIPELELT